MRDQYPGHVIPLSQSEAQIIATGSPGSCHEGKLAEAREDRQRVISKHRKDVVPSSNNTLYCYAANSILKGWWLRGYVVMLGQPGVFAR